MKALHILQSSLRDSAFRKTLSASSAKDVWDLLEKGNNEQVKLRRLEKQFEEMTMDEAEPVNLYLDRVLEIVEQLRRLKKAKSDYQVITKVLPSLSESYDFVAPFLEEKVDLKKMTLKCLAEVFKTYESEKGKKLSRNELPEYEMLQIDVGELTFDEDMWMIYGSTTNHMTPYVKFFTTLDRTHKARVRLINGSIIMTEGRGDVKIMTKEGKKAIKNVLYVLAINRNVLSAIQMGHLGYIMKLESGKCILEGRRIGKVFAETMWEEGRGFVLRYQVIEGNFTE